MKPSFVVVLSVAAIAGTGVIAGAAQQAPAPPAAAGPAAGLDYVLGPNDTLRIRVAEIEELNGRDPVPVDSSGFVRLPIVGPVRAAGLSIAQFETELRGRLKTWVLQPDVTASIVDFRSQPVSVIGAVKNPGVYQVQGRKTVIEMLSLAGGIDAAAGSTLHITRRVENGPIPLSSAVKDPTGKFTVAQLSLKSMLEAKNPEENIAVQPDDVITVPRAKLVYVVGEVQRAGGFPLYEREDMTVLRALSLAGGLDRTASAKNAKIVRVSGSAERSEIAVNLKGILDGKSPDVTMQPEDILFIPSSTPKRVAARALEAAVQTATGVAIWRR